MYRQTSPVLHGSIWIPYWPGSVASRGGGWWPAWLGHPSTRKIELESACFPFKVSTTKTYPGPQNEQLLFSPWKWANFTPKRDEKVFQQSMFRVLLLLVSVKGINKIVYVNVGDVSKKNNILILVLLGFFKKIDFAFLGVELAVGWGEQRISQWSTSMGLKSWLHRNFATTQTWGHYSRRLLRITARPIFHLWHTHGKHYGRGVWADGSVFHTY